TTIGKVDFDADKLKENLEALLVALKKAKPSQAKGVYIKKVSIYPVLPQSACRALLRH
ncbi:hypothetical protein MJN47_30660, partial [Salmonella enterica subsp. enterica serovar Lubbock]|nr:hypothetical protein [Salmonella enterica subsp. enterica serovar Lubbock]